MITDIQFCNFKDGKTLVEFEGNLYEYINHDNDGNMKIYDVIKDRYCFVTSFIFKIKGYEYARLAERG